MLELDSLTETQQRVLRDVVEIFETTGRCLVHRQVKGDELDAVEDMHVLGLVEIRGLSTRSDPRDIRRVIPTRVGRGLVSSQTTTERAA